jgi:hypothetical protein
LNGDGITVRAINGALLEAHFAELLAADSIWILLAIALVGVFILVHTGAPLLTLFGMLHVILSFPFSYFFLQLFFDIGAMGVLNFLGIFIILGEAHASHHLDTLNIIMTTTTIHHHHNRRCHYHHPPPLPPSLPLPPSTTTAAATITSADC